MRNIFIGGFIALLLAGGVALFYTLGGFMNVAATHKEPPPVAWLLHTTYRNSVEQHAADIKVPAGLGSKEQVLSGALKYLEMCSGCHTAPGVQRSVVAEGLNPPPPHLAKIFPHRTKTEAFWVIKHGVRMTGMPAFGPTHSDEAIWEIVAFIDHASKANPKQFQTLMDQAQGKLPPDAGLGHRHSAAPASEDNGAGRHSAHPH